MMRAKENKKTITKQEIQRKQILQKIHHPLAGGDDIKCQTVDQHQGEICKMRVSNAKRAQNALANVHVLCVRVCVCIWLRVCTFLQAFPFM